MTREIFIDTGAWIALADTTDNVHLAAIETYPLVLQQWDRLVTTNLVVAEAYNLIRRRLGYKAGMHFLETLRKSPRLIKVYSDETLETQAETFLHQYSDQTFSLVDAVSFALMTQREIGEAFAFDRHFITAGFTIVPPHLTSNRITKY